MSEKDWNKEEGCGFKVLNCGLWMKLTEEDISFLIGKCEGFY